MIALVAELCLFVLVGGAHGCSSGWHSHNGRCFYIHHTLTSWDDAKGNCESQGAYLAEDRDSSTHNFLKSLLKVDYQSHTFHKAIYIIGGRSYDYSHLKAFKWVHFTHHVTHDYWPSGYPDRWSGHKQECMAISGEPGLGWGWDGISCSYKGFYYVCET